MPQCYAEPIVGQKLRLSILDFRVQLRDQRSEILWEILV